MKHSNTPEKKHSIFKDAIDVGLLVEISLSLSLSLSLARSLSRFLTLYKVIQMSDNLNIDYTNNFCIYSLAKKIYLLFHHLI